MKVLLGLVLLLSTQAFAGQQLLLDISSDIDKETAKFFVDTDENHDVVGLTYSSYNGKQLIETKKLTPEKAEEGVVLVVKKGRNIVSLSTKNFSLANGGFATITYLYNGMTGNYNSMEIDLRRDGDVWAVYHRGKKIRGLKFLGKRVTFVGLVGVRAIQTY